MRGIDPRLLRRAREARVALAADAVLGSAAALLVLAQAVLLARVAAESFAGAPLDRLVTPLALLVAVVALLRVRCSTREAVPNLPSLDPKQSTIIGNFAPEL